MRCAGHLPAHALGCLSSGVLISPPSHGMHAQWRVACCISPMLIFTSHVMHLQGLNSQGYEIISTGGTAAAIEAVGVPCLKVFHGRVLEGH